MNKDIRLLLSFRNHPKTKRLRLKLGDSGPLALVYLYMFAAESKPDGVLSGMDEVDIALAADYRGDPDEFVSVLSALGLLDHDGKTYSIHDWAENNPWAAGSKNRSEKARKNANKKWSAPSSQEAQKTRSERLAAARELGTHSAEDWAAILNACGGRCLKCGADENIVKDHIKPIYQGGSDGAENLQPLCRSCNSSKGPDATDHRPEVIDNLYELLRNTCKVPAERLQNVCEAPAPSPSPSPSPSPLPKDKTLTSKPAARFDEWWAEYPKKIEKKRALEIWKRRKLNAKADTLIADVKRRKSSCRKWADGFIPNPTTYLNGDRWEDEIEAPGSRPAKIPKEDNALVRYAAERGIQAKPGESMWDFRSRVKTFVERTH